MADAPHDPNPLRAWLAAADVDLRGRLAALAADSDAESLVAWCGIRMDEVERIDGLIFFSFPTATTACSAHWTMMSVISCSLGETSPMR